MRDVYRIDLSGSFHLRGALRCEGQAGLEGRLTDISSRGAALAFWTQRDPKLAEDTEIDLLFAAPNGTHITAPARVVHSTPCEGFVRYGFEFLDAEELDRRVPILMRAMFNRRRSPRVKPAEPIDVELESGDQNVTCRLVDVSTSGMALELSFSQAGELDRGAHVGLEFTVPTSTSPVRVAGVVRGRRLVGPNVHLGVEFETEESVAQQQAVDALQDFVASREVDTHFAR